METGVSPIVTKVSAAVMEFTVILPPPTFCRPKVCESGCGFEVWAENRSRLVSTASCGGAVATVKDT